MRVLTITAVLVCFAATAWAGVETCGVVLSLTGRNELEQVSNDEIRAYMYRNVCSSSATGVDSDIAFAKAKVALNFSYTNKTEYCSTEKSQYEHFQFNYLRTSSVVEKALDSWLQCATLFADGIEVAPQYTPTALNLAVKRRGTAKGVIRGLIADAGTSCKGYIKRKSSSPKEIVLGANLNFQLPVDEVWTVHCERAGQDSQAVPGSKLYPETTVTLDTTNGPFSVTLPQTAKGAETWASAIDAKFNILKTEPYVDRDVTVGTFSVPLCFGGGCQPGHFPLPYGEYASVVVGQIPPNSDILGTSLSCTDVCTNQKYFEGPHAFVDGDGNVRIGAKVVCNGCNIRYHVRVAYKTPSSKELKVRP